MLLLGSFIGSMVAYSSFKGYKITGSPTLVRLAFAFFLLSLGLIIEGTKEIFGSLIGFLDLSVLEASLQASGYFLLAFSHAMNVLTIQKIQRIGTLGFLAPIALNALFTLRSLALLFLLYATTETFLSYLREKKRNTLIIALGLVFLIVGELLRWLSYFYPPLSLISIFSISLKVIGFSTLLIPVVILIGRGGKYHELQKSD